MWCFLLLLCLCVPSTVFGQILLNEVYYDHPGRDDGHEFIELVNAGSTAVDLGGCAVEFHDGASSGWTVVWAAVEGRAIPPGRIFVLGEELVAPPVDTVLSLGLQNGPDAVRLVRDGAVLDMLGYGMLEDPAFFEGASATDVPSGSSLSRVPDGWDTDRNDIDFRATRPSPGRYNVPRRDIELALGETAVNGVVETGPAHEIRVRLLNRGEFPVGAGEVTTVVSDSSAAVVVEVDSSRTEITLLPGDSVDVHFVLALSPGYHWIAIRARYGPDERPANNSRCLLRRVGHVPILVSEVMSHPDGDSPEYIEVYNAGALPLDLSGFHVRDSAHEPTVVTELPAPIDPLGYLVLTPDGAGLIERFPALREEAVVQVEAGWPSLNHSGSGDVADSVVVLDRYELAVDAVAYPPQPSGSRGRSLERVDLFPSSSAHTWTLSSHPLGGTPGWPLSSALLERPEAGPVTLWPNPFAPADGEALFITVPERPGPVRVVVSVFDTNGRRLRDIGQTSSLPFVFVWDGKNEGGRVVTPGIYVLACEFRSLDSGARNVERVVVGCGRKAR